MRILESWKRIADYLGRDVRTVQRWEHCGGLPVHRLPGEGKPGVWADPGELDGWRQGRAPELLHGELSIAVMPFANLTGDANEACFCEALADDIIVGLALQAGARVAGRTCAGAFHDFEGAIEEIAARLHVDSILQGAVKGTGDDRRISVEWIDARTGRHLWTGQYSGLTARDEVVRVVVVALLEATVRKV